MRFPTALATACVLVATFLNAVESWAKSPDFSCYQRSAERQPDWDAVAKDYARGKFRDGCKTLSARSGPAPSSTVLGRTTNLGDTRAQLTLPPKPKSDFFLLIRNDYYDVGLFSKPDANSDANGAQVSWSRNAVTNDTVWQTDGLFALVYSYLSNDYSPFIGVSVAGFTKINKEFHTASSASDSNADSITAGGGAELGFNNSLFPGADYFRLRWADTQDNIANKRLNQFAAEWMPTYLGRKGEVEGAYMTWNLRTSLKAQYDQQSEGLTPIAFSGLDRSLRVGPEATFRFRFTDFGGPMSLWAQPLTRLKGSLTYHWWTETYSNIQGSWLAATLKYNLVEDGTIALAFSYKKGRDEDTARKTDLFKISLNIAACQALLTYSGESCKAEE